MIVVRGFFIGLAALLGIFAIVVAGSIFGIWHTNTFGVAQQNANTNVTRHTNQYITSQQTALLTLMDEYGRATDPGQKKAIVARMDGIAATLGAEWVPGEVAAFLAAH